MMKRIFLLTVVLGLFACSLPSRSPVTPNAFMVNPERSGEPLKNRSSLWLKIGSVSVAPPYDGRSLVYRTGDQRYEKDFYNVYTTLPADMISNAERQWINKSGIFSAAVGQSNSFFPYYILQTSVEEFYGDYRVRPEAVVTVEFFLTATDPQKRNPVIGKNRYTKRIALKDNTPQALALGQQEALAQILKEYEVVVYGYAGNLPPPLGQ